MTMTSLTSSAAVEPHQDDDVEELFLLLQKTFEGIFSFPVN